MHQRSFMGNVLDKVTTSTLILVLILGVVSSGIAFYFLSAVGEGIEPTFKTDETFDLGDAIYFSIVTVSSLGYGDYRPVGWGRLLTSIEVVYGLFFMAAIVSKLVSERISTLTKLVYASDTQRRLLEFIESANERNENTRQAIVDQNYSKLSDLTVRNKVAFATYKHFINYHLKYGDIGNDWDEKQIVRLIKAVAESTELANVTIRSVKTDDELHARIASYLNRAQAFSQCVRDNYKNERVSNIHNHILAQRKAFLTTLELYGNDLGGIQGRRQTISADLLQRVQTALPPRPWPDHVHKIVGRELKISNKMASKVISMLLEQGLYPPPRE